MLFSGIAVADFERAIDWYERLFGRSADIVVHAEEVMWHISEEGWVYVLRDADRAGHALVALAVADLDHAIEQISRRGIRSAPVEIVEGAGRKAAFTDPGGNMLTLIEVHKAEVQGIEVQEREVS